MDKKGKILIVDDNEDVLFALNAMLMPYMEKIRVTANPHNISRYINEYKPDLILLDMNFEKDVASGKEGFYWLDKILQADPKTIVILMTAYADTAKAVQAIKSGATDFIAKPWEKEKLLATISSALRLNESQHEVALLTKQVQALTSSPETEIIGDSEPMQEIFSIIEKIADTEANILILGENGTGKDLIARAIHNNSPRANNIFTTIDLGSISESLFESELFGYEKGAFTDAKKEKQGRIETASGGTLFLDEIANLSLPMQAKLLTTIEKRYISRLGAVRNIPINVRFITATNADIYKDVQTNAFRQDLLYRINTIELHIPPLCQRGNDVILLAEHFTHRFATKYKKGLQGLTNEAKKKLMSYRWPGNVRELQNAVERAVILSQGKILKGSDFMLTPNNEKFIGSENLNLDMIEQQAIEKALTCSNGNLNSAAEMLGISRFALYRKINKK